jgi:hypothetical protein
MATKRKVHTRTAATKKTTKTTAKAATKKVTKKAAAKSDVPYAATSAGMKQLKQHCEGVMAIVGDLILSSDPKMSQKQFTSKAHAVIRILFGMDK